MNFDCFSPWSEKPLGEYIGNYHIQPLLAWGGGKVPKKTVLSIIIFNDKITLKIQIHHFQADMILKFMKITHFSIYTTILPSLG